jgi:hypothetical protein
MLRLKSHFHQLLHRQRPLDDDDTGTHHFFIIIIASSLLFSPSASAAAAAATLFSLAYTPNQMVEFSLSYIIN